MNYEDKEHKEYLETMQELDNQTDALNSNYQECEWSNDLPF